MEINKRFPSEETRIALEKAGLPREKHSLEEILERLPRELYERPGKLFWLQVEITNDGQGWSCQYFNRNFGVKHFEEENTMADACASMYLYLAKEGLLSQ